MVGIWGLFWMFLFSYVMPDLKTVLYQYGLFISHLYFQLPGGPVKRFFVKYGV